MRRLIFLPLFATIAVPAYAQSLPAVPLADRDLAAMRGGFALPGGVDVSVGVVTDARIDGQLVVRSAYGLNDGVPVVQVSGRDGDLGLSADGSGAATADGTIVLRQVAGGVRVEFRGDRIAIDSLAGQVSGATLRNSASDRSIDIATNVDIRLSGVSADRIGSLLPRVETLALDATARLNR